MSGPMTVEYILKAQSEAIQCRLDGLRTQVEQLEQRFVRLMGFVSHRHTEHTVLPPRPQGADSEAWSHYLRQLELGVEQLESTLSLKQAGYDSHYAQRVQEVLASLDGDLTLAQVLGLYLRQRQQQRGGSDHEVGQWRAQVTRILERLELKAEDVVPLPLEQLARQVILAETPARAELLANELRLQVQQWREAQEAARVAMEEAREWLAHWPEHVPAHLMHLRPLLEAAGAGLVPLDAASRRQICDAVSVFEAEASRLQAETAGRVLEQSLQDLGYVVEEIGSTLFMEGGMVHFQKPGWAEHFIRMRVNPEEKTVNFNVVRPSATSGVQNSGVMDTQDYKRADFMAEERWCAEFPRLQATLATRGLAFKVTRLLEAGELPVQTVALDTLPDLASQQARIRQASSPLQAHSSSRRK